MTKKYGFTLAEIMISLAIFSVITLGVFSMTRFLTTNSRKTIVKSDHSARIQNAYFQIFRSLKQATTLSWPPLKIHSEKLQFAVDRDHYELRFENKNLMLEKEDGKESEIIKNFDQISFYRHDDRLMEISWVQDSKELKTFIWMNSLNRRSYQ